MGQSAEHWVGINCGIMDQFASVMGLENKVIKIRFKISINVLNSFWTPFYVKMNTNNIIKNQNKLHKVLTIALSFWIYIYCYLVKLWSYFDSLKNNPEYKIELIWFGNKLNSMNKKKIKCKIVQKK